MTVFEVLEPSPHRGCEAVDDFSQALALRPTLSMTDRVLELVQALLPRPFHRPLEVVAQEVKSAFLPFVHDSRFGRVYGQPVFLRPLFDLFHCSLGLFLTAALDNKIVRIPGHFEALSRHQVIQWVQIQKVVCQTLEGINAKGLCHPCLPGKKLKFRLGRRSEMELKMNVPA